MNDTKIHRGIESTTTERERIDRAIGFTNFGGGRLLLLGHRYLFSMHGNLP